MVTFPQRRFTSLVDIHVECIPYAGNEDVSSLPKTKLESEYTIDSGTINHRYEFRSAMAGYANVWVVEFGKILEENLQANYVQGAFGKLAKKQEGSADFENNLISFTLQEYKFESFQAYVSINISLTNGKGEVLNKTYSSTGKSQGGKMFWGGVFAMKNATQQSTKMAIDQILEEFIQDINNSSVAAR